jgi:5-methyltetrahydrofolate--homocysteine methyltransferase
VVLGTVKGDLHDIGKRLVGIMMEGQGFRVVDLGHDVAPERFVEAAREEEADLVGMSALLSTTMPMMRTTLEALRAAGLEVRALVGGAPVTQDWADEIGADGYAPDAVAAAARARELLQR